MFDRIRSLGLGLAEIVAGTYIVEQGKSIRAIINVEGVPQWDSYNMLVESIGKFPVDALVSWGYDIGGALILISAAEFGKAMYPGTDEERVIIEDLINFSLVGVSGALASLGEIVDIMVLLTSNKCSPLGCGDLVDLAIFAGMAAYPFIRKRMRESRSTIEVE